MPILVFLGLAVLDLGPMYATDRQKDRRQTDVRQYHFLMPPPRGRGHNNHACVFVWHAFSHNVLMARFFILSVHTYIPLLM